MTATISSFDHLKSSCLGDCAGPDCEERVKEEAGTGRWFITMGHAGYNSPANNRSGYASKTAALKAHQTYGERGRARAVKGGVLVVCEKCGAVRPSIFETHCEDTAKTRPFTADEAARFIVGGSHALAKR